MRACRCATSMRQCAALKGSLTVRNTLVAAADLRAQWLGGPVEVVIRPEGDNASTLSATGTAAAAQLKPFLPSAVKVSGSTQWRLATEFHSDAGSSGRKSGVRIESDLRGLGVALPEPVGKSESEERPFQVTLEADGDDAVLARSWLGDVRSIVRVARSGDRLVAGSRRHSCRWQRTGAAESSRPAHRRRRRALRARRLAGIEGRGRFERLPAAMARRCRIICRPPTCASARSSSRGYRWSDVRGVLQATTAGWRVDVDGPGAAGQVLIPEQFTGSQALRATLERLVLEKAESSDAGSGEDTRDPRDIPNLQVHVGELRVGTRTLGTFDLQGDARAAGHPLRQRLDPRRLGARRRAGRLADHAGRPALVAARRR